MKKTLSTLLLLACISISNAQELYVKTFGKASQPALIFLHGGPGYNCASFEATTAQNLADAGFFVIVYDRRGEGRSKDPEATYTFRQTNDDLNLIYEKYKLKQATLIGHSFGGIVAAKYGEQNLRKVKAIVLVGAPISLQESFKTILKKVKTIYTEKGNETNLNYVKMLEKMDTTSLQYSSYSFMHAMQNGFYSPAQPGEEAQAIYASFKTDSLLMNYASKMGYEAPQGFWKNEQYTTLDLSGAIRNVMDKHIPIYGIYGKEDGLYSTEQIENLRKLIGKENVMYLDNCSHSVFIDQQAAFINALSEWVSPK